MEKIQKISHYFSQKRWQQIGVLYTCGFVYYKSWEEWVSSSWKECVRNAGVGGNG